MVNKITILTDFKNGTHEVSENKAPHKTSAFTTEGTERGIKTQATKTYQEKMFGNKGGN